jgi:competence protein ComEA
MFRVFSTVVVAGLLAAGQAHAFDAAQQKANQPANSKSAVRAAVNINAASVSDLQALPGIGAKTAALIVEYRQKNGPFKKIEELMNVRGVGEKSFLKLKGQITVATTKPEPAPPQQ